MESNQNNYDAVLLLSFGGPNGPDDVIPFLENVLRGRRVPRERMLEVAEHYQNFGGVSPINQQNEALLAALEAELGQNDISLPLYWGNRNWLPLLPDTLRQMQEDGIKNALCFVTSIFSSYSGCRQYLEDIDRAQQQLASENPNVDLVRITKLRSFYNHPGLIETVVDRIQSGLDQFAADQRDSIRIVFTAHSIPNSMSDNCDYVVQLEESSRLVCQQLDIEQWDLVYQSRSGSPHQPWLEPDVCDHLQTLHQADVENVILVPLGFVSDHMEVIFDLDTEAADLCRELGIKMVRVPTPGVHPSFVMMIRHLIEERLNGSTQLSLGARGPSQDECPQGCCALGATGRPSGQAGNGAKKTDSKENESTS